ncbi:LysR substrate-binding domain-containing protein [Pseudomonas sp. JS3066]|uniref:LysR substrate-binding domain-containing protein n=2 Tax=Pseudomonas TaxID=286 RepID=UPI00129E792F|nr:MULTISPECIES: LysR family transcriptional regulator [unclassified Pseudomonas]MDH4651713.1 LysR family transcriptional regulator [Pseudomonas sp. BN606]MRK22953.1 LysR family transcriptional regulator [Pseudomonas sp. JG-B]WVK91862.1 LysR substrate-binding domain-containing protein [Pseudomonas sp. JS3066]
MAFDRLEAMRAFCRIVEVGSFTGAAESLSVAKTTISGQIQGLESLLGVKLLHRTTRRVTPTTDGAAYYERARAVLDDLDELEASVAQSRSVARGRVRVEMPSPVGACLIIPSLPDFATLHPQIQLDIGCSERVVDLVQEGIDCAFRGGPVADQGLVCRPVGQMRFCLCASPAYLSDSVPILEPGDLLQHRYLGFTFPGSGKQMTPVLRRGDESFTVDQLPAMRFNNGGAYITAGLAGLGIVSVPLAEASPHLQTGKLVEVLSGWALGSMPISLVYPYSRHLSARVRVFADWAAALMASDPLWKL